MNTTCCPPETTPSRTAAPGAGVTESLLKPRFEIERRDDAYQIRVEMPGVPKSGVNVEFHDEVLSVRGERKGSVPADWKPLHQEIPTQGYQLRLNVNVPIDAERLSATHEDGVLTLSLPVKPAALPRRIEVA